MTLPGEKHSGLFLAIGILVSVLGLMAGPALAALSFSGSSISGDGAVVIDSSSTITIGNSATTITLPGMVSIGAMALGGLADPSVAPMPSLIASPGNVDSGTHEYCVAFTNATTPDGQNQITLCGPWSATVTTDGSHGEVQLTVPLGPPGTTGRVLWRTCADCGTGDAGGVDDSEYLATIPDNTTTAYVDNTSDNDAGGAVQRINTTNVFKLGTQPAATITSLGIASVAVASSNQGPYLDLLKSDGNFYRLYTQVNSHQPLTTAALWQPNINGFGLVALGAGAAPNAIQSGVYIGDYAGHDVTSSTGDNVFIGAAAGQYVTTAIDSVGIGIGTFSPANADSVTGLFNTELGAYDCGDISTGQYNTCVGAKTGDSAGQSAYPQTGSGNTIFGALAGFSAGDNNSTTVIGYQALAGANGAVAIGAGITNSAANTVNIGTDGKLFDHIGSAESFSALPTCDPTYEGSQRPVSDSATSTFGAIITGGGLSHVLAYCDGANWTVMAK